jgi:hypothetical protein
MDLKAYQIVVRCPSEKFFGGSTKVDAIIAFLIIKVIIFAG